VDPFGRSDHWNTTADHHALGLEIRIIDLRGRVNSSLQPTSCSTSKGKGDVMICVCIYVQAAFSLALILRPQTHVAELHPVENIIFPQD